MATNGPVRDFAQSATGGWLVVNGDFAIVSGLPAVRQSIDIGLNMQNGECQLDESVGIDWINDVDIKDADPLLVKALITALIAARPDVTDVFQGDLNIDPATREAAVSYSVDTTFTQDPISATVGIA